jgi:hypothetical protein
MYRTFRKECAFKVVFIGYGCSQLCNLSKLLLEEDVFVQVLRLLSHAGGHELLGSRDAVSGRSSSLGEGVGDELSCRRIDVFNGHELLMEDNLLSNVRAFNPTDTADIFQNDKTVRYIFPEKARVFVEDNLGWV